MDEINKIIREIRIADMAGVADTINSELRQSSLDDAHISAIQAEMEPLYTNLVTAINKDQAESDLDKYDTSRDEVYRSLLHLCKGYLYHPDAQVSKAAAKVDAVTDKYGFELTNQGYSAESALLDSLMADMALPEIAPSVEVLPGVKELKAQLLTEQDKFKAAEAVWLKARSEQKLSESATSVKHELLTVINDKLVIYLRAMSMINPEPYRALSSKLSLLIDQVNTVIKRRRSNNDEVVPESN